MNLAQHIIDGASNILNFEGVGGLPKEIDKSGFFVAEASDETILAHGVIKHAEREFKIGTKKK